MAARKSPAPKVLKHSYLFKTRIDEARQLPQLGPHEFWQLFMEQALVFIPMENQAGFIVGRQDPKNEMDTDYFGTLSWGNVSRLRHKVSALDQLLQHMQGVRLKSPFQA